MALAPGPEDLACSARGCSRKAEVAIIWSNPAIHTGRSKHGWRVVIIATRSINTWPTAIFPPVSSQLTRSTLSVRPR